MCNILLCSRYSRPLRAYEYAPAGSLAGALSLSGLRGLEEQVLDEVAGLEVDVGLDIVNAHGGVGEAEAGLGDGDDVHELELGIEGDGEAAGAGLRLVVVELERGADEALGRGIEHAIDHELEAMDP